MFVNKYYQVHERRSESISFLWKASHIISIIAATISSFVVTCQFPLIQKGFNNYCILHSQLYFTSRKSRHYPYVGNFPYNRSFNNPETLWSPIQQCTLTQFSFLIISMVGFILAVFLIIIPKGGIDDKAPIYTQPYHMVIPAFCITLAAVCTIGIAASKLLSGLDQFCSYFIEHPEDLHCSSGIDVYTLIYHKKKINVSTAIWLTRLFSKLAVTFWVIFFFTLLTRIIFGADFKIIIYKLEWIEQEALPPSDASSYKFEKEVESSKSQMYRSDYFLPTVASEFSEPPDIIKEEPDAPSLAEFDSEAENSQTSIIHSEYIVPDLKDTFNHDDLPDFNEPTDIEYDMNEPLLFSDTNSDTNLIFNANPAEDTPNQHNLELAEDDNNRNIQVEERPTEQAQTQTRYQLRDFDNRTDCIIL